VRTARLRQRRRELRHTGDEGSRACDTERLRYLKRARLTKRFSQSDLTPVEDYVDALDDATYSDGLLVASIVYHHQKP
jgi:hypothetical protein